MNRLLFQKTGRAKYISHLDLMRTFQRAFMRAGIKIKHTEGFNPHAYISVALPLSVGQESYCELLDFGFDGGCPISELCDRLNAALPEGLKALKVYEAARPVKQIAFTDNIILINLNGAPSNAPLLESLFERPSLVIPKRTKSGIKDTDIRPMIRSISFNKDGDDIMCRCILSAQNPSLNPENIIGAVKYYYPGAVPESYVITRISVLDKDLGIFE